MFWSMSCDWNCCILSINTTCYYFSSGKRQDFECWFSWKASSPFPLETLCFSNSVFRNLNASKCLNILMIWLIGIWSGWQFSVTSWPIHWTPWFSLSSPNLCPQSMWTWWFHCNCPLRNMPLLSLNFTIDVLLLLAFQFLGISLLYFLFLRTVANRLMLRTIDLLIF